MLDLLVTNARELIGDVKIRGSLGCSDHALVEFALLREMGQAKSKVRTLNFRKANLQLFKESLCDSLGNCKQGEGSRTELADLYRCFPQSARSQNTTFYTHKNPASS